MNMADRMRSVSVVNSCIVVMATNLFNGINGGLAMGKYCGDIMCPKYEYCNSDNMCDGCTKICDINSNNYEFENCERNCQDYIHDHIKSYVRASDFVQLQGTVETLQTLVVVSLTLSVFLILAIGIILVIAWYRYRQVLFNNDAATAKSKQIKKKMASVNVISNNNETSENRLALKIPPPVPESEQGCPQSAVTTTTPLSTRHPSEDNTLEYAYDNPALTPSPGTNLRRTETTF